METKSLKPHLIDDLRLVLATHGVSEAEYSSHLSMAADSLKSLAMAVKHEPESPMSPKEQFEVAEKLFSVFAEYHLCPSEEVICLLSLAREIVEDGGGDFGRLINGIATDSPWVASLGVANLSRCSHVVAEVIENFKQCKAKA